jgi:hypothetical protein
MPVLANLMTRNSVVDRPCWVSDGGAHDLAVRIDNILYYDTWSIVGCVLPPRSVQTRNLRKV